MLNGTKKEEKEALEILTRRTGERGGKIRNVRT